MTYILGFLVVVLGFVFTVKAPFLVALLVLAFISFIMVHNAEGLELFIVRVVPMILLWIGAIVGWIYYYTFFQPSYALTVPKVITWMVTP